MSCEHVSCPKGAVWCSWPKAMPHDTALLLNHMLSVRKSQFLSPSCCEEIKKPQSATDFSHCDAAQIQQGTETVALVSA